MVSLRMSVAIDICQSVIKLFLRARCSVAGAQAESLCH
jgi:hypothetical protein